MQFSASRPVCGPDSKSHRAGDLETLTLLKAIAVTEKEAVPRFANKGCSGPGMESNWAPFAFWRSGSNGFSGAARFELTWPGPVEWGLLSDQRAVHPCPFDLAVDGPPF